MEMSRETLERRNEVVELLAEARGNLNTANSCEMHMADDIKALMDKIEKTIIYKIKDYNNSD